MTRAQERLTLTHASSRLLWGRQTHNLPSRFLDELPEGRIERERLRPTSWSSYNAPGARRGDAAHRRAAALDRRLACATRRWARAS